MVFVFCGHNYLNNGYLNSIEGLDVQATRDVRWKLMDIKQNDELSERINPLVAPIGPTEIVILGGSRKGEKQLGDGYLWNTANGSFTQVIDYSEDGFRFSTNGNQCASTRRGQVAGLISDSSKVLHFVTYTKGD